MRNVNFIEGIKIIAKYIDESKFSIRAEHDQIWFGEYDDVREESDRKKLEDLGWFKDEESWSCFA